MDTNTSIDKKGLTKLRILMSGVFVLTLIGIVLRTFSMLFFYDSYIGYFSVGELLPIITNIFFLISAVIIIIFTFILPKDAISASGCEVNLFIKVSSVICAVASLVIAPLHFITWIEKTSFLWIFGISVLLLIASVYFAINLVNQKVIFKPLGAIAVVLLFLSYLAMSYFDVFLQMNSPDKIMMHISCLSLMLFFVSEARCASDTTRKKLYLFSISVAIFFTGVEAIPSIIAILLNKTRISDYLTYNILLCSVFIYLIARAAIMMSSHITDAEEEPQNELEEENDSESANLPEAENDDNKETTDLQEGI